MTEVFEMARRSSVLLSSAYFLIFFLMADVDGENLGSWKVVVENAGVSAMHMALLHTGKVIIFDRTDTGPSNISLPDGKCRKDPNDSALKLDCSAHSIEYDIASNRVRPLMIQTDTWCSSGASAPDGRLIQTGGFNDGERVVRIFPTCNSLDNCDWQEISPTNKALFLAVRRWYATDQILPDGRIIIIGGRRQFNYEFLPKTQMKKKWRIHEYQDHSNSNSDDSQVLFSLPFLEETRDSSENNLYPFVHLAPDGNLFIFANTRSILLDYKLNRIVRKYPEIPGGDARNYPSSGGSVLLPLDARNGFQNAEVLICGGARPNSNAEANRGNFLEASKTCGRLKIMDQDPKWEMETMPGPRIMGDTLLLPTGDVLIINGAQKGTAGWGAARDPALNPFLYRTYAEPSNRFSTLLSSRIPRMYHSSCHLLPDGRILVGGSNTNIYYNFTGVLFPTELRLEVFSPPYLSASNGPQRPKISWLDYNVITFGKKFRLHFRVQDYVGPSSVFITLLAPSFTTHSNSHNQRLLKLLVTDLTPYRDTPAQIHTLAVTVISPPSMKFAPPGFYLLFVIHAGVPSPGEWIQLK